MQKLRKEGLAVSQVIFDFGFNLATNYLNLSISLNRIIHYICRNQSEYHDAIFLPADTDCCH